MPQVLPVGYGTVTVKFSCTGDPEPMVTTFAFRPAPAASTFTALDTAAGALVTQFEAAFVPNAAAFNVEWRWIGASAVYNTSDQGLQYAERPRSLAGSAVGQTPMTNSALLVRKATASGGRKNRGRHFVPPFNLNETVVDRNGVLDASVLANQQNVWTSMVPSGGPTGWKCVVLHTQLPGAPAVAAPTDITALVVQSQMATQRRRMRP